MSSELAAAAVCGHPGTHCFSGISWTIHQSRQPGGSPSGRFCGRRARPLPSAPRTPSILAVTPLSTSWAPEVVVRRDTDTNREGFSVIFLKTK